MSLDSFIPADTLHSNLQDPIQLILDIVRLEFSSLASAALLLVLYYKVRVLEPEKVFNLGCQSGCPGKYTWFRIGPLVVSPSSAEVISEADNHRKHRSDASPYSCPSYSSSSSSKCSAIPS